MEPNDRSVAIHFQYEGSSRRSVVLLHGWYADGRVWASLRPFLDRSSYSLLIPDLRGAGYSRNLPGPYDCRRAAEDVAQLVDYLSLDSAVIVGHSMGAKVGLVLGSMLGQRAAGVIGVAPVPVQGLAFDDRAWSVYRRALEDDGALASVFDALSSHRYPPHWSQDAAATARSCMGKEAASGYLDSFVSDDLSALVKGISVPMLAICGELDVAIRPEMVSEKLGALLTNFRMETIAEATHHIPYETPAVLGSKINSMILELS